MHHGFRFPVQQTMRPRPSCRQTRRAVVSFRGGRCAACNRRCPKLSLNSHNQATSNNGRCISISYAVFLPVYSARLLPSSAAGSSDSHFGKCLKCCVVANVLADHLCTAGCMVHILRIFHVARFSACILWTRHRSRLFHRSGSVQGLRRLSAALQ